MKQLVTSTSKGKDGDGVFRKSSASESGACVEVAKFLDGTVKVRDSKDPSGPVLLFNRDEWSAFLQGVQNGEFNVFMPDEPKAI